MVSVVVWLKNGTHTAERVQESSVLFIDILVIVSAAEEVGSSSNASDLCTGGGWVLRTARPLTVLTDVNLDYPLSL